MTRSLESTWRAFDGYIMRSLAESRVAGMLSGLGISYLYEHMPYNFHGYLPDFYLPALDAFIEVKGAEPTRGEIEKCERLHEETGCPVLLVHGRPDKFMHHDHLDGYARIEVSWQPRLLVAGRWGSISLNLICRAIYHLGGRIAGELFVSAVANSGATSTQPIGPYAVKFLHELSDKMGRRCRAIYDHNAPVNAAKISALPREPSLAERECMAFINKQSARRAAA